MKNKPDKSSTFEAQQKTMTIKLMGELPNLICLIVSALITKSILVWMDLIDAANTILSTVLVLLLSSKLKNNLSYEYNYGTGKVEAIASLCCDILLLGSLAMAAVFAVIDLLHPQQPSKLLFWPMLLKLSNVTFDAYILFRSQKGKGDSKLCQAKFASNLKDFLFDGCMFVILVITYVLRDIQWAWYISPILSLGLVVMLAYPTGLRMRKAVIELMDATCDEETQHNIIKVLVSLYDQYDEFLEVKSRISGEQLLVDIHLRFCPETTCAQIEQFAKTASKKLQDLNANIVLSVIIREK